MIAEPLLYAFSGFFMKLSDDAYDRKKNIVLAIFAGILCGVSIAYLAITSSDAACIFIAILIGTVLSLKVDSLKPYCSPDIICINRGIHWNSCNRDSNIDNMFIGSVSR